MGDPEGITLVGRKYETSLTGQQLFPQRRVLLAPLVNAQLGSESALRGRQAAELAVPRAPAVDGREFCRLRLQHKDQVQRVLHAQRASRLAQRLQ